MYLGLHVTHISSHYSTKLLMCYSVMTQAYSEKDILRVLPTGDEPIKQLFVKMIKLASDILSFCQTFKIVEFTGKRFRN